MRNLISAGSRSKRQTLTKAAFSNKASVFAGHIFFFQFNFSWLDFRVPEYPTSAFDLIKLIVLVSKWSYQPIQSPLLAFDNERVPFERTPTQTVPSAMLPHLFLAPMTFYFFFSSLNWSAFCDQPSISPEYTLKSLEAGAVIKTQFNARKPRCRTKIYSDTQLGESVQKALWSLCTLNV